MNRSTPRRLVIGARSLASRVAVTGKCEMGSGCRLHGVPVITRFPGSVLSLGSRVTLTSTSRRTALGVAHPVVLRTLTPGAVLIIEDDVGISGGTVCAAASVTIGTGSILGANVTVADTDFHPLDSADRRYAPLPDPRPSDAVIIGRNVFIGTGAIILKGTNLGDDCVVGAGAVVKGRFPSGSVVAGNPARSLRSPVTTPAVGDRYPEPDVPRRPTRAV